MSRATNPEVRDRIESAVEDLDETIREIRTAIFGLHHRSSHADALRDAVLAATAEATRVLGFSPAMRFDGPVEHAVPAVVGEALVAVLREPLSNVARHARAGRVEVEIKVADAVTLSVADDGIGLPPGARHQGGRGMVNMEARARALGGRWQISAGLDGGTVVQWSVPLNEPGSGHACASAERGGRVVPERRQASREPDRPVARGHGDTVARSSADPSPPPRPTQSRRRP
jgi:signal transduction histidine kinase